MRLEIAAVFADPQDEGAARAELHLRRPGIWPGGHPPLLETAGLGPGFPDYPAGSFDEARDVRSSSGSIGGFMSALSLA